MVGLMGFSTSFATSGMISLIGTAFVPFMVTETTDRSVDEIQIELYGNRILPRGSVTEMKSVTQQLTIQYLTTKTRMHYFDPLENLLLLSEIN